MAIVTNNERVSILGTSGVQTGAQHTNSRPNVQQFTYETHHQAAISNMTLDVLNQNHSQMSTTNVPINLQVNDDDNLVIDQSRSLSSGQVYHGSSTNESTAIHTLIRLGDSRLPRGLHQRSQESRHDNQAHSRQYSSMINKNLPLKKIKVDFSRFVEPESAVAVSSQCDNIIDNVSCAPQVPSTTVDSNLLPHSDPAQVLIVANSGSQQQQNMGYLTNEFNSHAQHQVNQLNSSLRSSLNGHSLESDRIQAQVGNHYNEKNIALNFSHDLTQPSVAHQVHPSHSSNQHHLLHQDSARLLCENSQFNGTSTNSNWRTNHLDTQQSVKHPNVTDLVFQNGCSTSGQAPAPPWNQHSPSAHATSQLSSNMGVTPSCYRQNSRSLNIPNQFNGRSNLISSDHQSPFSYSAVHHQPGLGHMGYRSQSHHQNHHSLQNPHPSLSSNHYDSRSNSRSQNTTPLGISGMNDPSSLVVHNSDPPSAFDLNPPSGPSNQPSTSRSSSGVQKQQNFECSTCGKVLPSRSLYQIHLKSHSQVQSNKAKFSCEMCGHSFSQKTSLNRHMKSHTGERPFPCEICAKAFSEKERLKIHMRTHTGEKPFSCHICGKSFSQKSTVKRHQTVHTGEKKFRCDCGKGFANRGNLIAHIKTRGSNHSE